jgi:hypothetical protein
LAATVVGAALWLSNQSFNAGVTVYGRLLINGVPAVGASMKSLRLYCAGRLTGPDGVTSCTRPSYGWPSPGVNMQIVVHIEEYRATTGFTTR